MKGVVLAGGKGKRLRPWTYSIPKALINVAGKPMINYVLESLQEAKLTEVCIVVSPESYGPICERLSKDTRYSLKLTYVEQERPLGTADALAKAEKFIGQDAFLVAYCDHISFYNPRKLIDYHVAFRPLATLLLNKEEKPQLTGQVVWEGEFVKKIVEKPIEKVSDYGISGLMVMEKEIFHALPKIKPSAENEYHIGDALQYMIDSGYSVRYLMIDTWRVNVNSLEDLKLAEALILNSQNRKGL